MLQENRKRAALAALASPADISEESANLDEILGRTLKTLRQRANLTQADVAEFLDISPQQYQKYEKGASKCSLTTIYRLAKHYGVRPEDLLPKDSSAAEIAAGLGEAAAPYGQAPADIKAAIPAQTGGPIGEAAALAEILAIFIRIPNNETRRKILDLLSDIF